MSQPEGYDVVVLGSGAAGKLLAWALASRGRRTAVVERRYVGGSCPNNACLPSKNVIHAAKVASYFHRGAEFGIASGAWKLDMAAVRDRKRRMVALHGAAGRRPDPPDDGRGARRPLLDRPAGMKSQRPAGPKAAGAGRMPSATADHVGTGSPPGARAPQRDCGSPRPRPIGTRAHVRTEGTLAPRRPRIGHSSRALSATSCLPSPSLAGLPVRFGLPSGRDSTAASRG